MATFEFCVQNDEWFKNATPSTVWRRCYGYDAEHFAALEWRCRVALTERLGAGVIAQLRRASETRRLGLLTGTRDAEHCGAEVP